MKPIYRPSELRAFLSELGIDAKKSLSQNFLIDKNILEKICALAEVQQGDQVVEIGPGPGALTQSLLSHGAEVIAIEKDRAFASALKRLEGNLRVVEGDALEVPLEELLPAGDTVSSSNASKIVANLPYGITTPLLARFLPLHSRFSSMTVMVQKEVAERITAKPHTANYSSLTLFVQFYAEASYGFTVDPNCFYPKPRVHSAVVKLSLRQPPQIDPKSFFLLTRRAFQQRRKMLRASLKEIYPAELVENTLASLSLNPHSRPEELTLNDFLLLYERLRAES